MTSDERQVDPSRDTENSPVDERERRARVLRELAQSSRPNELTTARSPQSLHVKWEQTVTRQPHWQVYLAAVLSMVLVASIVTGVVYWRLVPPSASQVKHSNLIAFSPWANLIDCVQDIAWSPNGAQMALVGYDHDCPDLDVPGPKAQVGLLLVYDAHHGALFTTLYPDSAILPTIKAPSTWNSSSALTANINYTHIFWLPDQHHLALTYTVKVATGAITSQGWPLVLIEGVLVMDIKGGPARVLQHIQNNLTPSLIEWDLATGKPIPVTPALASHTPKATIMPASAYNWALGGVLTPQQPLPLNASTSPPTALVSPIGTRNGGSSFSIWQPGVFSSQIAPNSVGRLPLTGYNFTTALDALSPDGRYLLEGASVSALVTLPGVQPPSLADLGSYGWSQVPRISARDAALSKNYQVATSHSFQSSLPWGVNGILVAWSPDGQFLAVDSETPDHYVTVYDTHSGATVQMFMPNTNNLPPGGRASREPDEANMLRWSPDSKRLAFLDTTYGTVTIWNW